MTIECPFLAQFPQLKHGFFGTDHPEVMRPIPLITLEQVHGTDVVCVTKPLETVTKADGVVTRTKGIALGILTADCGPILFCDPANGVIGACHAGWKGTRDGIIQETLRVMEEQGAVRSQIYATLGPTIQQMNYEVGPEFLDFFPDEYEAYFCPSPQEGHHYFDLPSYILNQLTRAGVGHVHDIQANTFTENFASRRRLLSEGGKELKTHNLSVIAFM
jgi:YfiH family protein